MTAVASTRMPVAVKPRVLAMLASPAVAVFLSTNAANAGNLLYNILFSHWMGPELFGALATLLTLKLSLLALLNALQLAVSQRVSADGSEALKSTLVWLDRRLLAVLAVVMMVLVPFVLSGHLTASLGFPPTSSSALALLLLALPITAPLCLMRGVALGRLAAGGVVASGQAEMAVRLIGGVIAWQADWGLAGVVAALALSLVAGWWPLRKGLAGVSPQLARTELALLGSIALPFAALQLAQVALLDADVIVARLTMNAHDAGLMAVLSLFQRIQFYACFGLAGVLLPAVSAAVARGESGLHELRPVAALYAAVTVLLLSLMAVAPGWMVGVVSGPAFSEAAPALFATGVSAACFTASYLLATLLAAWQDRRGLIMVLGAVPVQMAAYALAVRLLPDFDAQSMAVTKAGVQAALTATLLGLTAIHFLQNPSRRSATC